MRMPGRLLTCVAVVLSIAGIAYAASSPVRVIVNGVDLGPTAQGRIIDGQVMIPLKAIEALGASVRWDPKASCVYISTTKAPALSEWRVVKSWTGSGIKQTESFRIASKEWRISWTTKNEKVAGLLQIFVYTDSGELVTLAANQQGAGSDVSYVRSTPGRYYLTINSANVDWTVTVEDQP